MRVKLTAQNLLAWGKTPVEIDLIDKGLVSVRGRHTSSRAKSSNGCGKSTILNSVAYLLYGQYPQGFKKSEMINEDAKKNCLVEGYIEKNNKTAYIVRGIKCERNTYSQGQDEIEIDGDFTLFFIDGKDCRGNSTKTTQANIDQFLQLDYDSFITAALFANSNEAFAAKTSSKQEEIFSKLLHLDELELARQRTRDRQKEVNLEISDCDNQIDKLESHIEREKVRLTQVADKVKRWKEEQTQRLSQFENRLSQYGKSLTEYKEQKEEILDELEDVEELLTELENEVKDLNETEYQKSQSEARRKLSEIDENLGEYKGLIKNLNSEIKQAQSMRGTVTCPKCFNEVSEEHLYEIIEEKNQKVEEYESTLAELNEKRAIVREEYTKAEEELNKIRSLKNKVVSQESKVSRLNSRIDSIEKDIKRSENSIQETEDSIAKLKKEEPPMSEDSIDIQKDILRLEREIDKTQEKRDELNQLLDDLEFWKVGFGPTGIRNLLVRSIIPELTQNAQRFADILCDGEVEIRFSGETEVGSGRRTETRNKLDVQVLDKFGSNKYHKLSAGEKNRVNMCVNLALHHLVTSRRNLDFIIMDEIFLSLDEVGKQKVFDLLNEISKEIPTVLVISNTEDVLSEAFNETWVVERKGKQSRIVIE